MKNSSFCKSIFAFVILFTTLVLSQFALAAQINLAWDANTESDLAGYKVYYGTSSKSYTNSIDVGNVTTYTLTGLTQGQTYYIAITAYNTSSSESGYSGEVSGVATAPTPPVSETPPTVTSSPTSETTTTPETSSTPTETPSSSDTTSSQSSGGGGCTRDASAAVQTAKYIGTHLYMAVSEINVGGPSIGNIKKYEVSSSIENPTNSTNSSNPSNSTNPSNSINSNNPDVQVLDSTQTPVLDTNNLIKDSSRSYWSTQADGRRVDKGGVGEVLLKRSKRRHIFTNLGDSNLTAESNAFSTSNEKITPKLLGLSPKDKLGRERLIQYVQGYDSYTTTKDNNTTLKKRQWILGAVLHSRPLVIPYGNSRLVIFAGANDGMFHAFDDATGEELWGFIPSDFLSSLREMTSGSGLKYSVDGSPKAYITTSKKIIIFGLRRGGSHYYALDVTDSENPKFLWKIGPETSRYSEMGQSWSTPQIGKIRFGTGEKVVCFIGGGYDENQDKKTVTTDDKKGRAVYVVDILTGEQVWRWDYGRDPDMKYSIPSDISRVDTDGDGYIDRLYVGDMGGRMWRFSIRDPDPNAWSGRIIFNSSIGVGNGKRKIFYPPDVTLEKDHEMVLFGTGDREHPNETNVTNRFYAVKDKGLNRTLTEDDLVDVTEGSPSVVELGEKEGWFISLESNRGEKVTGGSVVAYRVVYFTTFAPSRKNGENIARVYALNYQIGNAILNLNAGNDTEGVKIELSDRSKVIGTGIPSGTVITVINGKPVGFTGFNGGLYRTPLRRHFTIIPIWWRQVF
jgi:type IV pilus assembly protein PilY1